MGIAGMYKTRSEDTKASVIKPVERIESKSALFLLMSSETVTFTSFSFEFSRVSILTTPLFSLSSGGLSLSSISIHPQLSSSLSSSPSHNSDDNIPPLELTSHLIRVSAIQQPGTEYPSISILSSNISHFSLFLLFLFLFLYPLFPFTLSINKTTISYCSNTHSLERGSLHISLSSTGVMQLHSITAEHCTAQTSAGSDGVGGRGGFLYIDASLIPSSSLSTHTLSFPSLSFASNQA